MELFRSHILICGGTGCTSSGSAQLLKRFEELLEQNGLTKEIKLVHTGCFGLCEAGPVVIVYPEGAFYSRVKVEDVDEIVSEHLIKGRIVQRLLYHGSVAEDHTVKALDDVDFYRKQKRVALRNCGVIDPENIDEYIAFDGYKALYKVLNEMTPEEVIDTISKSGLRGRGGGGFPTGKKWAFAAAQPRGPEYKKYVCCNADEGDPGAFMDRSVLEGDPHAVLEAMAIAGYAIGSDQGYIYVRAEYPIAVKRLEIAIEQAREYGLLGEDIFGTGFNFNINIRLGAGAFVCGEETALMNSIQGNRGEPWPRPPFPAVRGLFGKPTILNNVETYANVCQIILNGPEWFASMGTERSKGTKVFALGGKINNTGLVEVPMGTTLREIIYEIGGGIPGGKAFKAVQTGGPSGGCLPAHMLDTPVDYDNLIAAGSMMGSGGMIVMDEDNCMVDIARFFLDFTVDESCGKCTPCRIGTRRMLEILNRICDGKGEDGDIERLENLAQNIKATALCGLGQTAPNPVLSTLQYFAREYEEHIQDHRCEAGVCSSMFISPCQNACPAGVNVPGYMALIQQGRFMDAYRLIRQDNPFPAVCGRVCTHPCERKCRRRMIDSPVNIRGLKRAAVDYAENVPLEPCAEATGKHVAVVGGGPSGLSAAYYLRRMGHNVTVYEAKSHLGGMLRYGIPSYRFPREKLQEDIDAILALGIEVKRGVKIGEDMTMQALRAQHDAVYIAIGAHTDKKMGIEGEDAKGVTSAVDLLSDIGDEHYPDFTGDEMLPWTAHGPPFVSEPRKFPSFTADASRICLLLRRRSRARLQKAWRSFRSWCLFGSKRTRMETPVLSGRNLS